MSYEKDKKEETDFEELAQHLESIAETINRHKAPEQNDIDTCKRILYSLNKSLSGDKAVAAANACDVLEAMQNKMKALFENEKKQKETENELRKEVEQLKQQVKELQIQMKELRDELTKAQTQPLKSIAERQAYEVEELILVVCQMPFTIEKLIIEKVLPKSSKKIYKLKDMESELEDNDDFDDKVFTSKKEKMSAISRWEKLQKKLEWDPKWDPRSMKAVKDCRLPFAHKVEPPDIVREKFEKLKEIKKEDGDFTEKLSDFEQCLWLYETLLKPDDKET